MNRRQLHTFIIRRTIGVYMTSRHTEERRLATDGGERDQDQGGSTPNQRQQEQQPQQGPPPSQQPGRGQGGDTMNVELDVDTNVVQFSAAVFLVFGVGTTVAFLLFGALAPVRASFAFIGTGGATLALFSGVLLGPLLAIITGLTAARRQARPGQEVAVSAGAGAAAGFLAMVIVQFVLATVLGGGGGGGGGVDGVLGPAIGYTIGVGLTGAAAGYVGVEL